MTGLLLHACVLLASLSNAHHWSGRKGLGGALFFRCHDFMHLVLLGQIFLLRARDRCQRIHPQNWSWSTCELVEVVLVDGSCELDVDPDWGSGTCTGQVSVCCRSGFVLWQFETDYQKKISSILTNTQSFSTTHCSEFMGLCFFAFGKSLGFFFGCGFISLLSLWTFFSNLVVPRQLIYQWCTSVHVQVPVLAIWIFVVFRSCQSLHQELRTALG